MVETPYPPIPMGTNGALLTALIYFRVVKVDARPWVWGHDATTSCPTYC